jgi:hypothetical protein
MTVNASAQEILDFMKHWTQAQRLCTDGIDIGTRDSMLRNIEWFEAGNTLPEGWKFEEYRDGHTRADQD